MPVDNLADRTDELQEISDRAHRTLALGRRRSGPPPRGRRPNGDAPGLTVVEKCEMQKPRSIGNAALPDTHGASRTEHLAKLTGSGTRDLIRSAGRMRYAASHSVLQGHRYRVVIDSLSKSKFPMFLAGNLKPLEFEA